MFADLFFFLRRLLSRLNFLITNLRVPQSSADRFRFYYIDFFSYKVPRRLLRVFLNESLSKVIRQLIRKRRSENRSPKTCRQFQVERLWRARDEPSKRYQREKMFRNTKLCKHQQRLEMLSLENPNPMRTAFDDLKIPPLNLSQFCLLDTHRLAIEIQMLILEGDSSCVAFEIMLKFNNHATM